MKVLASWGGACLVKVRYAPAVAWVHVNLYVHKHCTPDHVKGYIKLFSRIRHQAGIMRQVRLGPAESQKEHQVVTPM